MRSVLCFVLLAFASLSMPALAESGPVLDPPAAAELLALVNATRREHGVPPLRAHARLASIAADHTLSMARTGVLRHNDALFTEERHRETGIAVFTENVGYEGSPGGMHDAFLDSPRHRANLLRKDLRVAGFAVARDAAGVLWATEDFGTEPAQPSPRPSARKVAATPARPARARVRVESPPAAPARRRRPAVVAPGRRFLFAVRDLRERPNSGEARVVEPARAVQVLLSRPAPVSGVPYASWRSAAVRVVVRVASP